MLVNVCHTKCQVLSSRNTNTDSLPLTTSHSVSRFRPCLQQFTLPWSSQSGMFWYLLESNKTSFVWKLSQFHRHPIRVISIGHINCAIIIRISYLWDIAITGTRYMAPWLGRICWVPADVTVHDLLLAASWQAKTLAGPIGGTKQQGQGSAKTVHCCDLIRSYLAAWITHPSHSSMARLHLWLSNFQYLEYSNRDLTIALFMNFWLVGSANYNPRASRTGKAASGCWY